MGLCLARFVDLIPRSKDRIDMWKDGKWLLLDVLFFFFFSLYRLILLEGFLMYVFCLDERLDLDNFLHNSSKCATIYSLHETLTQHVIHSSIMLSASNLISIMP